jgi:hypothetical protein
MLESKATESLVNILEACAIATCAVMMNKINIRVK